MEHLESQIRDLTQQLQDSNAKRDKFEVELKASIDKIFVLREIISDLETQVETKALNEHVMGEKVKVRILKHHLIPKLNLIFFKHTFSNLKTTSIPNPAPMMPCKWKSSR